MFQTPLMCKILMCLSTSKDFYTHHQKLSLELPLTRNAKPISNNYIFFPCPSLVLGNHKLTLCLYGFPYSGWFI